MFYQKYQLRPDDPDIYLTAYIADGAEPLRDAMLVIPGGGYGGICSDREGEPIALAFLSAGVNAFVLHYSINEKAKFPRPLVDASLAMVLIRQHAEEFHINPDRVFAVGFSAGGHLAAALGTLWHLDTVTKEMNAPYGMNKPAGMLLCYAVISALDKTHMGTFCNVTGTKDPTPEQLAEWSLNLHVDERTAPAFIMHTFNDEAVPITNAVQMAAAMVAANRPFEMHVYPDAPHGVALGNWITACNVPKWDNPNIAQWVDHAIAWMKQVQ